MQKDFESETETEKIQLLTHNIYIHHTRTSTTIRTKSEHENAELLVFPKQATPEGRKSWSHGVLYRDSWAFTIMTKQKVTIN